MRRKQGHIPKNMALLIRRWKRCEDVMASEAWTGAAYYDERMPRSENLDNWSRRVLACRIESVALSEESRLVA